MSDRLTARALFAETLRLRSVLAERKAQRARMNAAAEKWSQYFCDQTRYTLLPEHLANAVPLIRRYGVAASSRVIREYKYLFTRMEEAQRGLGELISAAPPLKLDFKALPLAARCYVLAPFLDIRVGGKFPPLDLSKSDPVRGHLVYAFTGGPCDPAPWRAALPAISEWLGGNGSSHAWEITSTTVDSLTLTKRVPLPLEIPMSPSYLTAGALYVGHEVVTHRPHYVPFADMAHILMAGTTGMGKSNGLHVMMHSLLHNLNCFQAVHCVCGSGGVAFNRYKGLHPKLRNYSDPVEVSALTTQLVDLMRARERFLAAHNRDKVTNGYVALVIDEYARFNTADTDDKQSDEHKAYKVFMNNLLRLGKLGRKAGIRLILSVQNPIEPDVPAAMRGVLPSLMSFRLPVHASTMWGELEGLPANPRTLQRGRAVFRNGITGEVAEVQFPVIPGLKRGSS